MPSRSLVAGLARPVRFLGAHFVLVTLLVVPLQVSGAPTLSSAEQRLLEEGRILFKTDIPAGGTGGAALGGTALALLRSDTETVWRTLVDFPGHARLFPRVSESQVLERQGERTLVRYEVTVGLFAFRFFVNNYADLSSHLLRWQLDRGQHNGLFRDQWGYWKVEPWGKGVLVTYAMGGRTVLPAFLTRGGGQEAAILTLKALKERVERSLSPSG